MGFNLRAIKTAQSFEYEVLDQSGSGTGVLFTLASPTNPARKAMEAEQQRRIVDSIASRRRNRSASDEAGEAEKLRAKQLAMCTLGWSNFDDEHGNPVPYSREAAQELFADPSMHWLAQQIDVALTDDRLFTKGPSES